MVNPRRTLVVLVVLLGSPVATRGDDNYLVYQLQPCPFDAGDHGPVPLAPPPQAAPPQWQAPGQFLPAQQTPQPPMQAAMQPPMQPAMPVGMPNGNFPGGTVFGRLLDKGRPLVNCRVVIVPLHEVDGVTSFDEDRKPLTTVTDPEGVFRFDGVPPGGYKLTWLPDGQRQWIRRISLRPDVKVHNGETTRLKEIRVALHTIN
ncbi:MAG: carboxypeptidase-like regulatory domain-containing protein [Thermoguttaceae bacterium]|jgi:hypothetical protein